METLWTPSSNQRPLDLAVKTVDSMRLALPGANLKDIKRDANTFQLTNDKFAKYVSSTQDTIIQGMNSQMAGLSTEHRIAIFGVRFLDTVTIGVSGRVVFTNCVFDKQVIIISGGRASFTNCTFKSNIDNTLGLAVDVGVIGCLRLGPVHLNVTIIYEITG